MMVVGNSQYQKIANCLLILNLLRHGPMSRIEISHKLGLQPSTVTYSVSRLIERGCVVELVSSGSLVKTVGRKRNLIGINKNFGRVVGVELLPDVYNITVSTIAGDVVKQYSHKVDDPPQGLDSISKFKHAVSSVVDEAEKLCAPLSILGICIAIPGIVRDGNTFVEDCWTHGLLDTDFSEFLESFNIPVLFENDANCAAMKYLWAENEDNQNFLYLQVRTHIKKMLPENIPVVGIGLGVVINGELFRGSAGHSGEYRSSRIIGCQQGMKQISVPPEDLLGMNRDEKIVKRFVYELISDVLSTASILDPESIYIGGALADSNYRKEVESIIFDEMCDDWVRKYWYDKIILLKDPVFDASQGAGAVILERLFRVPQVGGSMEYSKMTQTLLGFDIADY